MHWTQRDMAEAAGVALGSVGAAYKGLRAQEYLRLREEHGDVVREIVKASALLERWLIGYGDRLRRNLLLRVYRLVGNQSVAEIVPALENAFGGQVLVGGELGATLLEPGHLHPGAATLHLDPAVDVKKLALRLRLVPDKDGNVTLLQTFGTANALDQGHNAGVTLAHPLLLYAELLQGTDPRTREFAREFYDARIKGTLP
ncbi:type IV toxin-antitoxin system AbiEi family antitoxin [Desulfovibrio sp. DV]|uniref:type IV toxin-antitoxin system AbiEi family antitoxin n=1 Tax=Desulfovibrio sp. DV TaxID=1844708 RepID=UPI001587FDFB|nr:type IV toxin-antitoxin system AbiEi family antitoxin [Desulfovibrio sp. DV]